MKKTSKSKLRLNSQTIRNLKEVVGGRVAPIMDLPPDDTMNCTDYCTMGCRGCG